MALAAMRRVYARAHVVGDGPILDSAKRVNSMGDRVVLRFEMSGSRLRPPSNTAGLQVCKGGGTVDERDHHKFHILVDRSDPTEVPAG